MYHVRLETAHTYRRLRGYAPGGAEAMVAIGLSLGYDPAYVAVHHFARIFALLLIVPMALRI